MAITGEQFDEFKESRSPWSGLIKKLLHSKDGHVEIQAIPDEHDSKHGRRQMNQSIRALARYHGFSVSLVPRGKTFLVKRVKSLKDEVMQ